MNDLTVKKLQCFLDSIKKESRNFYIEIDRLKIEVIETEINFKKENYVGFNIDGVIKEKI